MESKLNQRVPNLRPSEFDDYIFENWKPDVSPFYEKFHIERIENYKEHLKIPLLPHRRSVYFFLFVTKGEAVRSKGLTEYIIRKNSFFCLPANQITSLSKISRDVEGFYCHFLPDIFNHPFLNKDLCEEFDFFRISGNPLTGIELPELFLQLLQKLESEYRNAESSRFEVIPLYLAALFKEIDLQHSSALKETSNAASLIVTRYKDLLVAKIEEIDSVNQAAEKLRISPNHLNKSVKAVTGKTAQHFLDEMRILEAKVLLKQTRMPVAEIAAKLGKTDPSSFSRFFKKKTENTPLEYRNKED